MPSAEPARLSLLRYSPSLVLVLIVVADAMRYADTDLWGHLRFGQAMLSQRHLVLRDPYSYSAPGHLWRNHEWLCEVLMAALYNALGVAGLKLMKLMASAATIVLLVLGVAETGAPAAIQLPVLTLAAVTLAPQMQFRPQLFTFVFLAGLLAILARDNYGRRAALWIAVPLLALWANLHGGFIAGVAALGTYGVFRLAGDLAAGRGSRRGLHVLSIAAGATIATLITPYGIDTWYAVAHAVSNPVTRIAVADWQPLYAAMIIAWRTSPAGLVYFAAMLAMLAGLAYSAARTPRQGDLPLLAVAALMAVAAFLSARNMALFVIAAAGPLARHLTATIRARRSGEHPPDTAGERAAIGPGAGFVIAILLAAYSGLFSNRLPASAPFPAGAVAFMQQHGLGGNLLCDFNWGEYLIWHNAPRSRVFIDGRYDTVYPSSVIRDYLAFYFDQPRGAEVLAAYPHDFVLVPPLSGAAYLTSRSPDWTLVYRDPVAMLFARTDSAAAAIPPVRGDAPVTMFP
ncbi:MAG: hypothetical protein ACHQZS_03990 [Candidatus Binatales bacterium]